MIDPFDEACDQLDSLITMGEGKMLGIIRESLRMRLSGQEVGDKEIMDLIDRIVERETNKLFKWVQADPDHGTENRQVTIMSRLPKMLANPIRIDASFGFLENGDNTIHGYGSTVTQAWNMIRKQKGFPQ